MGRTCLSKTKKRTKQAMACKKNVQKRHNTDFIGTILDEIINKVVVNDKLQPVSSNSPDKASTSSSLLCEPEYQDNYDFTWGSLNEYNSPHLDYDLHEIMENAIQNSSPPLYPVSICISVKRSVNLLLGLHVLYQREPMRKTLAKVEGGLPNIPADEEEDEIEKDEEDGGG
ncbi:hypothetical protein FQR65_LT15314 [Abscondita terminalis]|nr:hypothetical protein FQR65_LT15314 [Abscondita terminalis]